MHDSNSSSETGLTWVRHRHLVSAVVSLCTGDSGPVRPYFQELGYEVNLIEPRMVDARGRRFGPDLHLLCESRNVSALVECKTGTTHLRTNQLECYFNITPQAVVEQGQLTLAEPRRHLIDRLFMTLSPAAADVASAVEAVASAQPTTITFGVVEVGTEQFAWRTGSLADGDLEDSLAAGWVASISELPLERIPYTHQSSDGEVAEFVLQALTMFFVEGRERFTLDEVCAASNEWWPFFGDQRAEIRPRVRRILSQVRRTALRGWLDTFPSGAPATGEWQFSRSPTTRTTTIIALQRRAIRYVELLRQDQDPRPSDFDDVDQLPLPIIEDGKG